jgi:ATP-dependent RNA helicase RhlE
MTFYDLNLNKSLLNALDDLGLKTPTTIQHKSFSVMMSGKDVLGIAQTGTGKTYAYLLPCLRQWAFTKDKLPQILILVPTRELVVQVVEEVKKLTKYMNVVTVGVYGGTNIKPQKEAINEKVDVLVATPGRLLDLALTGILKLKAVKRLVIDEVDEMLNLGFRPQLVRIFDLLPNKRQNLMFSATIVDEVEDFINNNFTAPVKIEAAPTGTPIEKIKQSVYNVPNFNTKINLLQHFLINKTDFTKVLVFVDSKSLADDVFIRMSEMFPEQVGVIHSNKDQNFRFNSVNKFQSGAFRLLIATDVIARGLDVSEVSCVINFDIPNVPENYMHRIGRTGRADNEGNAIAFVSANEKKNFKKIETLMGIAIKAQKMPKEVIVSDVLTSNELPKIVMKNVLVKAPKKENVGPAFHEKKDKNKKVNIKMTRADKMREKYGKPKKRPQKK